MPDLRHTGQDDLRDDQTRRARPPRLPAPPFPEASEHSPRPPIAPDGKADPAAAEGDPWAGLRAVPGDPAADIPIQGEHSFTFAGKDACGDEISGAAETEGGGGPTEPSNTGDVTAFRPEGELFLRFVGKGWPLLRLYIVNFVCMALTLGVYSFWAKTRVREYLWSRTLAFGEPLEYTGTGWQLCRSFLIVISVFFVLNLAMTLISLVSLQASLAVSMVLMIVLVLFWPYALYSALRYRLARTNWRGVHGWLAGSPVEYAAQAWVRAMLTGVTLGLFAPHATAFLTRFMVNHASFGTRKFRFEADVKALSHPYYVYWALSVALLAAIVAILAAVDHSGPRFPRASDAAWLALLAALCLGWLICHFIYGVIRLNWTIRGVHFGEASLDSLLTVPGYCWLMTTNTLLVAITLGVAWPWTQVRRYRYLAERVTIRGSVCWSDIRQDDTALPKSGEGLLSFLDLDLGF